MVSIDKVSDLLNIDNLVEESNALDHRKWQNNPFRMFIQNYQKQLDTEQVQSILKSSTVKEGVALWKQFEIQETSVADVHQISDTITHMNLVNIHDLGIEARRAMNQPVCKALSYTFDIDGDISFRDMCNVANGRVSQDTLHRLINQIEFEEDSPKTIKEENKAINDRLAETFKRL